MATRSPRRDSPVTWGAVATGDWSLAANLNFTGGGANTPVSHVCFWNAITGGTYYGSQAVAGGSDTSCNSLGEYTITALTVNGQST